VPAFAPLGVSNLRYLRREACGVRYNRYNLGTDRLVIPDKEENSMAIHLTPTELGREAGMHRREVIAKCMELGVPIFQGRIDKTLFLGSLKESQDKRELAKA
jgi:hypothetical protein